MLVLIPATLPHDACGADAHSPAAAVVVARVRQALVFLTGLLLALTVVLMPRYGLTGVGIAWLATACVLALALAATAPRWLTTGQPQP